MIDIEFMKRRRADAAKDPERIKVLARILPFNYLEWLDQRAAALASTIRQFDKALSQSSQGSGV